MTRATSWNVWVRQYQPIDNRAPVAEFFGPDATQMFETFGADLAAIVDLANHGGERHVWTLVDCFGARGRKFGAIVPGYHLVNRLGYYVTALPWSDEAMEVIA